MASLILTDISQLTSDSQHLVVLSVLRMTEHVVSVRRADYVEEYIEQDEGRGGNISEVPKEDILRKTLEVLAPTSGHDNDMCREHAQLFQDGVERSEPWALQMLDASVKPPDTWSLGENTVLLGNYNECVSVRGLNRTGQEVFGGQYCLVTSGRKTILPQKVDPVTWSLCAPWSCESVDIQVHLSHVLADKVVFGVFAFVISGSTIYDYIQNKKKLPDEETLDLLQEVNAFTCASSSQGKEEPTPSLMEVGQVVRCINKIRARALNRWEFRELLEAESEEKHRSDLLLHCSIQCLYGWGPSNDWQMVRCINKIRARALNRWEFRELLEAESEEKHRSDLLLHCSIQCLYGWGPSNDWQMVRCINKIRARALNRWEFRELLEAESEEKHRSDLLLHCSIQCLYGWGPSNDWQMVRCINKIQARALNRWEFRELLEAESEEKHRRGICSPDKWKPDPDTADRWRTWFSLPRNLNDLLSAMLPGYTMSSVHGLRFLTAMWVLLLARYRVDVRLPAVINRDDILDQLRDDWTVRPITSARDLAADTFFLLSGMLTCYVFFKDRAVDEKFRKLTLLKFYLYRYVRISCVYAVCIGVSTTLMYQLGSGAMWSSVAGKARERCRIGWWTNLVYVNNFVYSTPSQQCLPQSWWLAADMQLFLLSPLILYPLWKWPRYGRIQLLALLLVSVAVPFWYTYTAAIYEADKARSEFLATDRKVPSSIPSASRFSVKQWIWNEVKLSLVMTNEEILEYRSSSSIKLRLTATGFFVLTACHPMFVGTIFVSGWYPFGRLEPTDEIFFTDEMAFYLRTTPYLMGMGLGYVLHCTKCPSNLTIMLPQPLVLLGWIISTCSSLIIVYLNQMFPRREYPLGASFYASFRTSGWAVSIAWIIFACERGYGGYAKIIMSWRGFQPLGKLSYCMFLVGDLLFLNQRGSVRAPQYFTHFTEIERALGDTLILLCISTVFYLSFELPFINLCRCFLKPEGRRSSAGNLTGGSQLSLARHIQFLSNTNFSLKKPDKTHATIKPSEAN
uniref:Nose resistant-to-fluoxetine protein N-terminal domain-containing protein n=1 Tax=Timema shepardi TaxID=629360 RepID=A0A7R9B287_TIMSH|nr:unnamed protein product [Timema shepardi]